MAGRFYPLDSIAADRAFLLSLVGSIATAIGIMGSMTSFFYNRQLPFVEIAKVNVNQSQNDLKDLKPISEIGDLKKKDGSAKKFEYLGYLSNINDICKGAALDKERTMVVQQPDGTTVIGKIKIGPEACDVLKKLSSDDYKFDVISASRQGNEPPSYVSITSAKVGAGS